MGPLFIPIMAVLNLQSFMTKNLICIISSLSNWIPYNQILRQTQLTPGLLNLTRRYKGSIPEWMKLVNSIRLRLAMRLSKVDPALAQTEGEKALSDPVGLITSNSDNFIQFFIGEYYAGCTNLFPMGRHPYGSCMETFLGGLKDPVLLHIFHRYLT